MCAATLSADPPRVVGAVPDHGDAGVDPSLSELWISFDQDMGTGTSICGGGPTFPKITGKPRWVSTRELVVPISLETGRRYEMSINCQSFQNFRSAVGEACEITPVWFTTGAPGAVPVAPAAVTPEDNAPALSVLLAAIAERYSYRDRVVQDWAAAFAPRREEIVTAHTRAGFARAAARVLGEARDVHITLSVNGAGFPTFRPGVTPNADPALIGKSVPGFIRRSQVVATGIFEDGVAYLQIDGWPSDSAALLPAHDFLTEHADAPGMIIDVRFNGGGDEVSARRFAGRFAPARAVYSRNRVRDADRDDGWTAVFDRTVGPEDSADPKTGAMPRPCRAPAAVLIGPACMSSNESFVLMMKHGAGAALVGAATFGSSGNPREVELGNGVRVRLPTWEDMLPDGTVLEGRGVAPDVPAVFTGEGGDEVIRAARENLRGRLK